jgi:hypothetical protein
MHQYDRDVLALEPSLLDDKRRERENITVSPDGSEVLE